MVEAPRGAFLLGDRVNGTSEPSINITPMKKITVLVVSLLAIGFYASPFAVSTAGAAPSNPAYVPGPPQVMDLRITAYTSLPDETDSTPFITANGTYVHDGVIAANMLPFGTEVEIPSLFGDKIFTVEDRMAPEFKHSIDIWMPSFNKAIDFGLHHAEVVIIPPGPAPTAGLSINQ